MAKPGLKFWHHHVGVSVPNVDASIAWYRDILGFALERRYRVESIPAVVAVMRNGPMHVELFELDDAKRLPEERREPNLDLRTHGTKHVAFAVADVRAFADELKKRGADIVWVKDFKFGSNAFIRDNAGNLIEFVQKDRIDADAGEL
jgi:methylmalonyl-CoA/ethylmalonyl-CoA epimerase